MERKALGLFATKLNRHGSRLRYHSDLTTKTLLHRQTFVDGGIDCLVNRAKINSGPVRLSLAFESCNPRGGVIERPLLS